MTPQASSAKFATEDGYQRPPRGAAIQLVGNGLQRHSAARSDKDEKNVIRAP